MKRKISIVYTGIKLFIFKLKIIAKIIEAEGFVFINCSFDKEGKIKEFSSNSYQLNEFGKATLTMKAFDKYRSAYEAEIEVKKVLQELNINGE